MIHTLHIKAIAVFSSSSSSSRNRCSHECNTDSLPCFHSWMVAKYQVSLQHNAQYAQLAQQSTQNSIAPHMGIMQ
jgi:hypothetical protein